MRGEDIMKVLDIQIGDPLPQKSDVEFFFEKNKFFKHEFLKNIKIYDNPLHNISIDVYSDYNIFVCIGNYKSKSFDTDYFQIFRFLIDKEIKELSEKELEYFFDKITNILKFL